MNNKGQTLVLFAVLLPVILMLFAYVFDSAYIAIENNKLEDIAKDSVTYLMEDNKTINEVKNVILENDSNIEIVDINNKNVYLKKDLEPIFGKIVGINKYKLEANITGNLKSGKLILKEKGN